MTTTENVLDISGRVLIASIFLVGGISKISGYTATQGYMESAGVPGILLPAVILLELGGALAIVLGYGTRITAAALALFCVVTAFVFHGESGNQIQSILFMKNLAIAGGFLVIAARGAGDWSLDARRRAVRAAPSIA